MPDSPPQPSPPPQVANPQPPSPQPPTLWQLLAPLLKRRWVALALVVASMPVSAAMAMLVPYLTKVALDRYILPAAATGNPAPVMAPLVGLVALAAVVVVVGYLADALFVALLQRVGTALLTELRQALYAHTLRLPRAYFDRNPIGGILSRVTSDFEALNEGLATGVLTLVLEGMKTLGYMGMMFWLDWRLTLVVLILLPVLVGVMGFFQGRVKASFMATRTSLAEATGYLQEVLSGMKTVQLYGAENKVFGRYRQKNWAFFHAQNLSNWYEAMLFSVVEGATAVALALALWYASGEMLTGAVTIGVVVAFMEYIQRFFVPVREFSQQVVVLQRSTAALRHVHQLFAVPADPAEGEAKHQDEGQASDTQAIPALVFQDVRFAYAPNLPPVLKGVSFSLAPGRMMAVVGATGAGKSTLIRLLTRAYTGYTGHITLHGHELSQLSADQLARRVSVVSQNVFLFKGTVAFNIGLDRPHVSRGAIEDAAHYVMAHEFIQHLPGGYDFPVAQGGGNLSAGQCQLISLARAVVAQTELIVLDEATASVDSMTESLIQKALERLYHEKTVIAIAHRLSTIRHAHAILVMDGGLVTERGTHAELLAQGGLYAHLVGQLADTGEGLLP